MEYRIGPNTSLRTIGSRSSTVSLLTTTAPIDGYYGRARFAATNPNRQAALAQLAALQALPIPDVITILQTAMAGNPLGIGEDAQVYNSLPQFPNLVARLANTLSAHLLPVHFAEGRWRLIRKTDWPLLNDPCLVLPRLVLDQQEGNSAASISITDALRCRKPYRVAFMEKATGELPFISYQGAMLKVVAPDKQSKRTPFEKTGPLITRAKPQPKVREQILLSDELRKRLRAAPDSALANTSISLSLDFLHQCRDGTWQPSPVFRRKSPAKEALMQFYTDYRRAVDAYLARIEQVADLPQSTFEEAVQAIVKLRNRREPIYLDFANLNNTFINFQTGQISFIDPEGPSQVIYQNCYRSPITAFVGVLLGQGANGSSAFPLGLILEPDDQIRFQQATEKLFDKIRQAAQLHHETWEPTNLKKVLGI